MIEIGLPEPDEQVLGSNLTARYAHFDGIRVLIYEPVHRSNALIPAVVFFHGGGYALGSTSKLILRDEVFKIFCLTLLVFEKSVDIIVSLTKLHETWGQVPPNRIAK